MDNYILDFGRIYFASFQRGMTVEEKAFAIQSPYCLVEEYAKFIEEISFDEQSIYHCVGVQVVLGDDKIVPFPVEYSS